MFDLASSHDKVTTVVAANSTVDDAMQSLLDYCVDRSPWRGWAAFKTLDYGADHVRLKRWLKRVLTTEPPRRTIKAYWFGLFNPIIAGKPTCGLYVAGSTLFDEDDSTFEWACNPAYFPDGRYAKSQVLDKIYQNVQKGTGDVSGYGEYVLCLGYAGLIIKQLATSLDAELWLGKAKTRALAVGFDSGDGVLLGAVTETGWKPRTA